MPSGLTRAADGYDRRAFTVDEVLRMQELGIFAEDEKFELIEGDIVPVHSEELPHTRLESIVARALFAASPTGFDIGLYALVQLSHRTLVQPEACLYKMTAEGRILEADEVDLAVEITGSTRTYDRDLKARSYARSGIPELWIIDGMNRRTFVHRQPSRDGWGVVETIEPGEPITTAALPELSLVLPKV